MAGETGKKAHVSGLCLHLWVLLFKINSHESYCSLTHQVGIYSTWPLCQVPCWQGWKESWGSLPSQISHLLCVNPTGFLLGCLSWELEDKLESSGWMGGRGWIPGNFWSSCVPRPGGLREGRVQGATGFWSGCTHTRVRVQAECWWALLISVLACMSVGVFGRGVQAGDEAGG